MKLRNAFAASVLAFFWMFFFFKDVFIHPNAHMFNEQGDGIKAFYVFADHIKNDQSYHQQRNMNYPYGQTFVYTDGQPAVANAFKFLSGFFPLFRTHDIAIYNYLILFSFVACAFFIALILQRFKLPSAFIILGGFSIAALSPQIWRISGHPTMSYALFFPVSWYIWLKCKEHFFHFKWMIIAVCNTTFWFFVHPYLGMVITFFFGASLLLNFISSKDRKYFNLRIFISAFITIVIPLIILKGYTAAVDHHLFRSDYPWGFWVFYTAPGPIFLPHSGPFEGVFRYFLNIEPIKWDMEKINYIGLAVDVILLICIFRMFRFLTRKRMKRFFHLISDDELNRSFWAVVLLLLFAMCIPFKWGLESLVEHLGFLRQFRALGRFGWAFYYVATVYGIYGFYLVWRKLKIKGMKVMAHTFFVLFFSFFIVEAYPDVKERAKWAVLPKNCFNEQLLPEEYRSLIDQVNKVKNNYQCLVTLPFFHVGSENFGIEFTEQNIKASCIVSYWCNIPMLASSAARSPIVEAKNIMQFFSPGYIKKSLQADLPNQKDFLVLYDKEQLNPAEVSMLEKSKMLFDNGKFELRTLSYGAVFNDSREQIIQHFQSIKDSLHVDGEFLVSREGSVLSHNSFDAQPSENSYQGNGSLKVKKNVQTVLYEGTNLKKGVDYTVSYWYYNKGELRTQVLCAVEECNADGSNCRWDIVWDPRTSMVIDGDWSLVEKTFQVKEGGEKIKIFIQGDDKSDQDLFIDEFLLRETSTDVYASKTSGGSRFLFYNNQWVPENGAAK